MVQEQKGYLPRIGHVVVVLTLMASCSEDSTEPRAEIPVLSAISAGNYHTCAATTDGAALCWGTNDVGELGDGTTTHRFVPTLVAGELDVGDVVAGGSHTCALSVSRQAYCWGYGRAVDDGSPEASLVPLAVGGAPSFASLVAGYAHTCGLTASGAAYCWGISGGNGQLGDGTFEDRRIPTPVAGGLAFATLTAGYYHTCGLTAVGAAYCWGSNGLGQLGIGYISVPPEFGMSAPVAVVGGLRFTTLSGGRFHTCGLDSTGRAFCWGANTDGMLGDGGATNSYVPIAVAGNHRFTHIDASWAHTCATVQSGAAYCWGKNDEGQLGDGTTIDRPTPTAVFGNGHFARVTSLYYHTCGITLDGRGVLLG